eukprot:6728177-Ditylum_brightwellii.AAC.1
MPGKKKASGRGSAYTTAEKCFLLYGAKNRTVESLRCCFTNMHWTKAPSGDPVMAQEIREANMEWLQIHAKSECLTGSNKESASESKGKDKEDD